MAKIGIEAQVLDVTVKPKKNGQGDYCIARVITAPTEATGNKRLVGEVFVDGDKREGVQLDAVVRVYFKEKFGGGLTLELV